MKHLKHLLLTAAAFLGAPQFVSAADMPLPMPRQSIAVAAPQEDFSGFYLRGDVGLGITGKHSASRTPMPIAWTSATTDYSDSSSFGTFGAGVGYAWNSWLRTDVTLEYRGGSQLTGQDRYAFAGGTGMNHYQAGLSSVAVMANAYVDLGTWHGLTPFVGAGLGYAYNRMGPVQQNGQVADCVCGAPVISPNNGYLSGATKGNLAWALMAGIGYDVTRNVKLELGYRYMNMGKFSSGTRYTDAAGCACDTSPLVTDKLVSHDFRLGMRWQLAGGPAPMIQEPIMRKF